MDAKQNALEILRFGRPERVVSGVPTHGLGYRGCNHEGYTGGGHHLPVGSAWADIWGVGWELEHEGVMGFPRGHPLADLPRVLPTFAWPEPGDERICGCIQPQAAAWVPGSSFLCGSHRDTLWEKSYMLVGMADLMCYMHTDPAAVRDLLHGIMDFQLGIARHYLAAGVEMVSMSDDLGTQCGLLLSPETIHEFLVPEYRRLFGLYREHGVWVNFHSCGHIEPLLDLFVDLGVSILNPVQASANDLRRVRAKTQGRLALLGGVSSGLLMDGTPAGIRREVHRELWDLGREGGYFCAPDQSMPFPAENQAAFHAALAEFGTYPIQPFQEFSE